MFVVRKRELFGPLIPQEIKELVIAKYRKVGEKKRSFNFAINL